MSAVSKGLNLMNANARASLRELKRDDECLTGRQYHNSTLSGLANKEQEIENKIRVEESRDNPDQVYLKRLYSIRDCLRGTLSRYR